MVLLKVIEAQEWRFCAPPVRKPIFRRLGMSRAIAKLWEASERETGVALAPA